MKFKDIQESVIKKYNIDLDEYSCCWGRTHAHVKERRICKWHPKNSVQSTFELLHEIGHIETTKTSMRRCEEEFYATQWAIDVAEDYNMDIPQKIIDEYQNYIDMELARGLRRHGKNYPTKYDLKLTL